MHIIRPVTPTVEYSNIIEATGIRAPLWNSGTTYDIVMPIEDNTYVHVVNGIQLDIYECIQSGNLNHPPASSPTWWSYRSTTYAEYNAGTTYALGAKVIVAASHKIYESLQAGNIGHAVTETAWWLDIGATNKHKAFDEGVATQSERTNQIVYHLSYGSSSVDSIALFNLDGILATIYVIDSISGVVAQFQHTLISTVNVFDGYSYFFAPFFTTKNIVELGLPPTENLGEIWVFVTADADTSTAKVGEIVTGFQEYIGVTQYPPTVEIVDFSRKERDDYGNWVITERGFSNRISCDVLVLNSAFNYVKTLFEDIRATPAVYVTTEDEELSDPLLTYGYYKTFRTVIPYPDHAIATLEIEGLI